MNDKINKQIEKISQMEHENIKLNDQINMTLNEEQIAVSKKNDLKVKQTYLESNIKDAYALLKELIIKEG